MPFLDSILARLRPSGVTRVVFMPDGARASIDGKSVGDLYAEQPHLRTVVDFIASNVAQLTPKCYLRAGDTDRRRDTEGPLPLLLANPNRDMTGYDLVYTTVADYSLYGRAIWLVGRDKESDSGFQIRPIPPAWVTDWADGDGFSYASVRFRDLEYGGGDVEVPTSSCVLFTSYRPGFPARALSPVESLKQTLAEQVEAQAYRRSVWDNATRINGYISRPQGVEWSQAAADRFKADMRENWSKGGANAGRTPVLEDGMRFETVSFSAREGDWAAGVKLSREDCAAAYHVNPSIIWPGEGQTYASAKDNARALYADTLMPMLTMLQSRITKGLAPMVGAPAEEYVEFDISSKLQGSFEEQTAAMQSSVGAPWRTRNEARAMQNLPPLEGGDDLVTPLNVLVGGMASPADTAPDPAMASVSRALETLRSVSAPEPDHKGGCDCPSCKSMKGGKRPEGVHVKGAPTDAEEKSVADVLSRFFARQRKSVLAAMGAKSGRKSGGVPAWWDPGRWDRELADDLAKAMLANSTANAKRVLADLGIDPGEYDEPRTRNYLRAWAESRAKGINATTLEQLEDALGGEVGEDAMGATPAGVFDKAEGSRAGMLAATLATQVAGWSTIEAVRQCADGEAVKTWQTRPSKNPRPGHAALNGVTVGIEDKFPNGARFPGDSFALPASEIAHCHCEVEVTIKRDVPAWDPDEDVSEYTADNLDLSGLSSKALKKMKREKPEEWKGYVRLSQLGFRQRLLYEDRRASANFDMFIDDGGSMRCADLKTPRKGAKGLRKRLKEGYSKWERLSDQSAKLQPGVGKSEIGEPLIVVDNRFSEMTDESARSQIIDSMEHHSSHGALDYSKTLLIKRDGSYEYVER